MLGPPVPGRRIAAAALHTCLVARMLSISSAQGCDGKGVDRTSYSYQDDVRPSSTSPVSVDDTPQLISLTFDDNGFSGRNGVPGGVDWLVKMLSRKKHLDGTTPVLATFYHTTQYVEEWFRESPVNVKKAWRDARAAGHEVGLHSHNHHHGEFFSESQWSDEIDECMDWLNKPFDPNEEVQSPDWNKGIGATAGELKSWRTPFLEYNGNTMKALKSNGVWSDSSIEDGWQSSHDGTNYYWPYTLNYGSPGHDVFVGWGEAAPLDTHSGLWEMPVHPFIVPPDSLANKYGIPPGLRAKCKRIARWFDMNSGKITAFDYNLLVQFQMTAKEFLATLKHTLDLRLEGNMAPFFPGLHSDYYSDGYTAPNAWSTSQERRQALEDFVDYALSKPRVRFMTVREVFHWMRDPLPLRCLLNNGAGTRTTTSSSMRPSTTTSPAAMTTKSPSTTLTTTTTTEATAATTTTNSSQELSCSKSGLLSSGVDCRSSPYCCASSGHSCYQKNQWWASCRRTCTPGETDGYDRLPWECVNLSDPGGGIGGSSSTTSTTTAAASRGTSSTGSSSTSTAAACPGGIALRSGAKCSSNPDCCASGLTCYVKNRWWASCRSGCTRGEKDGYDNLPWECTKLSQRRKSLLRG